MRDVLKLGFILMAYTIVAGAALALVNLQTRDVIRENRDRVQAEARRTVLPNMDGGYEEQVADDGFTYWVGYKDDAKTQIGGYVFIARGNGYSSNIQTMVGIDSDGEISGARVIFQQETPGLGAKITEVERGGDSPWFTAQFTGRPIAEEYAVEKDGGDIDSITGATISSRTVTNSINEGLNRLQQAVGGTL